MEIKQKAQKPTRSKNSISSSRSRIIFRIRSIAYQIHRNNHHLQTHLQLIKMIRKLEFLLQETMYLFNMLTDYALLWIWCHNLDKLDRPGSIKFNNLSSILYGIPQGLFNLTV